MVCVGALFLQILHDPYAFAQDSIITECSVYDDLKVKNSLEQNDPVVKTFLEIFPDARYFAGGIDESDPPKIGISYEHKTLSKNTKLSIYVREVVLMEDLAFGQYITRFNTKL